LKLFPFWVKPRWSLLRYHFENIQSPKSWLISDLPKSICSEVFSLYIDNIKKPSLICWQDIATKAEWNTWSLIRYFRALELLSYFKFVSQLHARGLYLWQISGLPDETILPQLATWRPPISTPVRYANDSVTMQFQSM
jgi:hypothetical protein